MVYGRAKARRRDNIKGITAAVQAKQDGMNKEDGQGNGENGLIFAGLIAHIASDMQCACHKYPFK